MAGVRRQWISCERIIGEYGGWNQCWKSLISEGFEDAVHVERVEQNGIPPPTGLYYQWVTNSGSYTSSKHKNIDTYSLRTKDKEKSSDIETQMEVFDGRGWRLALTTGSAQMA